MEPWTTCPSPLLSTDRASCDTVGSWHCVCGREREEHCLRIVIVPSYTFAFFTLPTLLN